MRLPISKFLFTSVLVCLALTAPLWKISSNTKNKLRLKIQTQFLNYSVKICLLIVTADGTVVYGKRIFLAVHVTAASCGSLLNDRRHDHHVLSRRGLGLRLRRLCRHCLHQITVALSFLSQLVLQIARSLALSFSELALQFQLADRSLRIGLRRRSLLRLHIRLRHIRRHRHIRLHGHVRLCKRLLDNRGLRRLCGLNNISVTCSFPIQLALRISERTLQFQFTV